MLKLTRTTAAWCVTLALLVACGGSDDGSSGEQSGTAADAFGDLFVSPDGTPDTGADTSTGDDGSSDTGEDAVVGTEGVPGDFDHACEANDDCSSGFCVEGPDGGVCTTNCSDECPETWTCEQVVTVGTDTTWVCMPYHAPLCSPCETDAECGFDGRCVTIEGEGPRCARACSADEHCPGDHTCQPSGDPSGESVCRPSTGSCVCTPDILDTERACSRENVHGSCLGTEVCAGPGGWSGCSAQTPGPETCNGIDDDCDGVTDEATTGTACEVVNEFGTCTGVWQCEGADGAVCTAPTPAPETCNGVDDNCDGVVDEADALGCETWFEDKDKDGLGNALVAECLCGPVGAKTTPHSGDCNDLNPTIGAGTPESCNGVDDDCDGITDEPDSVGCVPMYKDGDQDGFGVADQALCLCGPAAPYSATKVGDCDDTDGTVFPTQTESCSGKDDNCNGITDEENATGCQAYYADGDDDGYGVDGLGKCLCASDETYVTPDGGDCKDTDPTMAPGTLEVCDGKDNDCDDSVDENLAGIACQNQNQFGACQGVTACSGEDGITCSAPIPAAESCNGNDDDCDGATDEPGADGCTKWYIDGDGDGLGDSATEVCLCTPNDTHDTPLGGDCDDTNAAVGAGQAEVCDGIDNDCDGAIDEPGAAGCQPYLLDTDGDDYGVAGQTSCQCAPGGGYGATTPGDCDDSDGTIHPGAVETCNNADDDCNGLTDEAGAMGCTDWLRDADDDGFGQAGVTQCTCAPTGEFTAQTGGDCNDADAQVNPTVTETCNGVDDNCDGVTDEGTDGQACTVDNMWGSCPGSVVCMGGDAQCVGTEPGAESCNGVDDNCDGTVDEAGAFGCTTYYRDMDGDGFGVTGDTVCTCAPTGDHTATQGGDCNDGAAGINPATPETCNGADDNCDGATDEPGANGCVTYYPDQDQDGYGVPAGAQCLCGPSMPLTSITATDCNDAVGDIHPGATEQCNNSDDDCDGVTDEPGAEGCTVWYADADGDQFGAEAQKQCLCAPSGPYVITVGGDCLDSDGAVNPNGTEVCDGLDNDCDGAADNGCDEDEDGYCGGAQAPSPGCPLGGGDCDDTSAAVKPGAQEICDEIDNDCDGQTDEGVANPCGGCGSSCTTAVGPNGDEPFVQSETTMDGVSMDGDGHLVVDTSTIKLKSIWIANSGQGSVSKINTETGDEEARYQICSNPSRTAVDSGGNGWVACRGDGKVVKISLNEMDCVDSNGNGVIDTSRDDNGDGKIGGSEKLPTGQDECVKFTVVPDSSSDLARAMGVDADDHGWVGMWNAKKLIQIDKHTGQNLKTINMSSKPYGLAIDSAGTIWVAARGGTTGLLEVDPVSGAQTVHAWNSCKSPYGITIDEFGKIWLAKCCCDHALERFDPVTGGFTRVALNTARPRGVAADGQGFLYVAADQSHDVLKVSTTTLEVVDNLDLGGGRFPVGMAVDFEGHVWAVNQSSSTATKIDGDTMTIIKEVPTGPSPYTYSDMTGHQLRTVVAPSGTYRHTFEGWNGAVTRWTAVATQAALPADATIKIRVRTADTLNALAQQPFGPWIGETSNDDDTVDLTGIGLVTGRYCEVELKLNAGEVSIPPMAKRLSVTREMWQP